MPRVPLGWTLTTYHEIARDRLCFVLTHPDREPAQLDVPNDDMVQIGAAGVLRRVDEWMATVTDTNRRIDLND